MSETGFLLRNLPFALEKDIAWRFNVRLHRRPSSAPFLSGDTYRAKAGLVIEENEEFIRTSPDTQGLVFCASSLAAARVATIAQPDPFVLVVHHGDIPVGEDFRRQLDSSRCVHCFAQNCLVQDPRVTPLPIGLEDQWRHHHGVVRDFVKLRRKSVEKIPRIVWGFSLQTNPDERWPCYRALVRHPLGVSITPGINSRLYRGFVRPYMFMASPPGNGLDCHRTWEALYLGIVPIVKRSLLTEYFAALGLPFLILDDWRELDSMNEERLSETYERLKPGFDCEALWLPYWQGQFEARLAEGPVNT